MTGRASWMSLRGAPDKMEYVAGIFFSFAVSSLAALLGGDRHRSFYPRLLAVIAAFYVFFSVLSGAWHAAMIESVVLGGFLFVAIAGFRLNPWLIVIGLFGHGVFDAIHGHLIANPGVPVWWPGFCLAYDIVAAAFLAWSLCRSNGFVGWRGGSAS
jgi:hypothetical protein